jgi:hypothetical protein
VETPEAGAALPGLDLKSNQFRDSKVFFLSKIDWKYQWVLQVEHHLVLPKSASWEPEVVRRKPKQVNAMIA